MQFEELWGIICEDYYFDDGNGSFCYECDDGTKTESSIIPWVKGLASEAEKRALRECSEGKIVDIGCGCGRHYSSFHNDSQTNYIGIDVSESAIKIAASKEPNGVFVLGNMLSCFHYIDGANTILLLGNVISELGSRKELLSFLNMLHSRVPVSCKILVGIRNHSISNTDCFHNNNQLHGRDMFQSKVRLSYNNCVSDWKNFYYPDYNVLNRIFNHCNYSKIGYYTDAFWQVIVFQSSSHESLR